MTWTFPTWLCTYYTGAAADFQGLVIGFAGVIERGMERSLQTLEMVASPAYKKTHWKQQAHDAQAKHHSAHLRHGIVVDLRTSVDIFDTLVEYGTCS